MSERPEVVETVTIDVSTETGLWCDACLLPSRYRVALSTMGASGVTLLDVTEGCDAEDETREHW